MSHDVVVLGSGAAGLTAALAAAVEGVDVGLYEKADLLGGTTAISGGVIWVPGNHLLDAPAAMPAAPETSADPATPRIPSDPAVPTAPATPHAPTGPAADSRVPRAAADASGSCDPAGLDGPPRDNDRREALRYLRALAGDALDVPVAEALLAAGPEMLRFVEKHSPCRFRVLAGYPDYHPDVPGARPDGGRSLEPDLFDLTTLGEWAERIRFWDGTPRPVRLSETRFGGAMAPPPPAELEQRRSQGLCGMGEALVGALLAGCREAGVKVRTNWRARSLITSAGRVTGVKFALPAGEVIVEARHGVIMATGGFEWNDELVRAFLRGPMHAPAGVPTNTGDGLHMAVEAGAALGNMPHAWWAPMAAIPGETAWGAPRFHLVLAERTRPGSIMVNVAGRRFCNEAANYNALGGAFHQLDPPTLGHPNASAWLVCDDRYRRRYALPGCRRSAEPPPWVHRGNTPAELAAAIGIPPAALAETVATFNCHAATGNDLAFGRGANVYDRFNGDRTLPGAAATLAPLDEPPFYAVAIRIGALGTSGGPRTDAQGRVLARDGTAIPGLWAAGNVMAAPTATVYPGAGGTLGPAMTFGYLSGLDASTAR